VPQKEVPAETQNQNPSHHDEVRVAASADEDGCGPVGDKASDWRHAIQSAQKTEIFRLNRGIEKAWANDGLSDTERNDDEGQYQVHREETPQLRLGIQQCVTHENKRNIVEKHFEAHQAVHDVRGGRIEYLSRPEPDED